MKKTTGIVGTLGLIIGLSTDQAIELGFEVFDRKSNLASEKLTREHSNIERVIGIWQDTNASAGQKSMFTAVLLQNEMVPLTSACTLIGYAIDQKNDDGRDAHVSLLAAFSEEFVEANFTQQPCDLVSYQQPDVEIVVSSSSETPNTAQTPSCPKGKLYTQFGDAKQINFGRILTGTGNNFSITAPELIEGYDETQQPVVRYFHADDEEAARLWHDLFEAKFNDVDFKYGLVKGYESSVSRNQFELWWPSSFPAPNVTRVEFVCS